jgi:hypothetical protein
MKGKHQCIGTHRHPNTHAHARGLCVHWHPLFQTASNTILAIYSQKIFYLPPMFFLISETFCLPMQFTNGPYAE